VETMGDEASAVADVGLQGLTTYLAQRGRHYPLQVLQDFFEYSAFCEYGQVIPVCSGRDTLEVVNLVCNSSSSSYSRFATSAGLPDSVKFGVPSLTEVSLADVVSLRRNEEVFADVREALLQLQNVCGSDGRELGWREYQGLVREHTD